MGHSWFDTIKKDYSDWRFAWAREAGQNSLDAGATTIVVTVLKNDEGDTVVTWTDNGCGMNAETLETKFMAVGGSEKPDGGTGGFGVAKLILAFAQKSYSIRTQTICAAGKGQKWGLETDLPYVKGLTLTAVMEGDEVEKMERKIARWVRFTTTKCSIIVNGRKLTTLRMHRPKLETPWCKVYTHKVNDMGKTEYGYETRLYGHKIRVRINQQYMFNIYSSVDAHITVDIIGNSQEYLTSNRDGMNVNYRWKLQKLVEELYENPNTIKEVAEKVEIYEGQEGKINLDRLIPKRKVALGAKPPKVGVNDPSVAGMKPGPRQSIPAEGHRFSQEFKTVKELIEGYDLVVANSTSKAIPAKWIPGRMNKTASKLMNQWIQVLQTVGLILGRTEEITPGWTFDSDARASCQYHPEYGHMVLLNPVKVGETKFTNYWSSCVGSFYEMVAVAVHELTHIDQRNHSEGFARDITYSMGKVMAQSALLEIVRKQTS
jgi:hypothetical protein